MEPTFSFDLVPTELGPIAIVFKPESRNPARPVVLFIHGFLRDANDLLHWHAALGDDYEVIFAELPGHGRSPAEGDCSVPALAQRFCHAIRTVFPNRLLVVVGASIGGVVALALADGSVPQIRGVIAGDPPLTTAKQWPVQVALRRYLDHSGPYLTKFAGSVFGFTTGDRIEGRIYYEMLPKVAVPTLILTGDVPLWPQRDLPWPHRSLNDIPNLLDEADITVIRMVANPHIVLRRIVGCGHLVLSDDSAAPVSLVREFCGAACGIH